MRCGAAFLTLILGLLILGRMPRVRQPGYLVMGGLVALVTTGLLMLIDASTLEYIEPADIAMILAMVPLVLLASTVILTEGIELAASLWRVERRILRATIPEQIPARLDPCALLQRTARDGDRDAERACRASTTTISKSSCSTTTPKIAAVWRPVEAHCAALGPRFRFFHFDSMTGFKAGALNKALELTDPAATYIAVIDSDYQVEPFWLRRALPFFATPEVALVQGPQDYRDGHARHLQSDVLTRNIAASSISAWWSATSTTPSSSTAR